MNRRALLLTACASVVAVPFAALAQPKVWRIGFLSGGPRPSDGSVPSSLRHALSELGYVDGKNVTYVGRWADSRTEQLPALAAELAAAGIDVMLTAGAPAADAAKSATRTIPVVFVAPGDAAETGLVPSLARPGGNMTGISDPATELSAKRLGILKEAFPTAKRVAVIWNANDRAMTLRYGEVAKAARAHMSSRLGPYDIRPPSLT